MKKFAAFMSFLVAIIVVVCLGLTIHYFLRNDEVINFNTKEIYCNVNDIITISDLGKTVTKENKDTSYNYNAGGEEVTSKIKYDTKTGYYHVGDEGGDVTLVITTSNKNCAKFKILVHIGDGSEASPYNISNQAELERIGSQYPLDAHYSLRKGFTLSNAFKPIGYNLQSSSWVGFSGSFNGNGNTISGLQLNSTDYANAGLFYSLNNATVTNLRIDNASINGAYDFVGILAGSASGTIDKVQVNGSITNTKADSKTGGLVGSVIGGSSIVRLSSATGSISLNNDTVVTEDGDATVEPINVIVGGLAGEINETKVQATYANVAITANNVKGNIAGFAGKFIVTADNGTIQQSYAVSTSQYAGFAAFIDVVEKSGNFADDHNYLKYLVGNYTVVGEGQNIINTCDEAIYTEYNEASANYYVVGFNSKEELLVNRDYVFYAIARDNKTLWDKNAWNIEYGKLPTLRMTNAELIKISNEYFTKDLDEQQVANKNEFIALIKDNAINGAKITLIKDPDETKNVIDLTNEEWTPVALNNSVIDFNGYVVKGLNLTVASGDNLGLFSTINNSTVKNLVIDGVKVGTGATNVGALAGSITATDANMGVSTIDNVVVTFANENVINSEIANFGGLVAVVNDGSIIANAKVNGVRIDATANIDRVGGLVATLNSGNLQNSRVEDVVLNGNVVAGVVAENKANINDIVTSAVTINSVKKSAAGVAILNSGNISNVEANVNITLGAVTENLVLGGISTTNTGAIENVTLSGLGITLDSSSTANSVLMAGLVVDNDGNVNGAYNFMGTVGTLITGKDYQVAGMFVTNSGNASVCVASSNLYGNYVSGAVLTMEAGSMDQLFIGAINKDTKETATNEIQGDKYVTGVAYDMQGTSRISNVQAESSLIGTTNDTRTSLIVLYFPDGTEFINATINSSVDGYGTFYRETWSHKDNGEINYNLYGTNSGSGKMQSVVINTERAESNSRSLVRSNYLTSSWFCSYENNENSSYVKTTNNSGMTSVSTFTTAWTDSVSAWWPTTYNFSHDMQFNIAEDGVWNDTLSGIRLGFLKNV